MKTSSLRNAACAMALLATLIPAHAESSQKEAVESCGTMQMWLRSPQGIEYQTRMNLTGTCPTLGACDSAANRDAKIPNAGTPLKHIQLRYHILADDNGANQVATFAQVSNQVALMNADFRAARIHFIHTAHVISNSTYRLIERTNAPGTTNAIDFIQVNAMKNQYAENPGTQLNVYAVDNQNGQCGYATFPWQPNALGNTGGLFVDRSTFTNPSVLSCATHEAGHVFGLLHTFRGVTEIDGDCNNCRELAGRSAADGDLSGDYCSDTPPEPGDTYVGIQPCPQPTGNDPCNGLPYGSINNSNFMSYYASCYNNFTSQQKGRMHCWSENSLSSWFLADSVAPVITITSPLDGAELAALGVISGTVSDDFVVESVGLVIREIDPGGGSSRFWNGTGWQPGSFVLATTITGTNWTKAASVALPPLNSGISYEITATALDGQFNATATSVTIHKPMEELVWDPGTTHLGTQVKNSPHTLGGPFLYKIITQGTTVGGWRTALNVTSGEADIYLSQGGIPSLNAYNYGSLRAGSDGFVLHSSAFSESQEWFHRVQATAGSTWNLVSGEPFVLDLGELPGPAAGGNTNVTMGAEGWRFFRTVPPAGTLAWRLWLNGATNDILVKKGFIPVGNQFEKRKPKHLLLVPDYLEPDLTYFTGVPGEPGQNFTFQSKQQPVTDIPFISTQSSVAITGFPYLTYRVPVPIDQIAWEVKTTPSLGNPNFAIRRERVPNEDDNDAFSEVPGGIEDSVTLVPPTLSDGTFYITVYSEGNHTFTLRNGEPIVTTRPYSAVTTNDVPNQNRAGWRYYVVSDIAGQLGTLGWELLLANQPPDTELALRRNAVPGRWNFRNNGSFGTIGYVDQSSTAGFLQRPGHQADIYYIGVYQPNTNLGAFRLTTRPLTPVTLTFNNGLSNVTGQAIGQWQFFRIDVPADVAGWDLRITNYSGGYPQFAVRRDLLPANLGGGFSGAHDWASGDQYGSGGDWTGYGLNSDGSSPSMLAAGRDNPLVPGTYYVGVRSDSGPGPLNYSFLSRGIGTNYAIGVSNLNFSGPGSSVTNNAGLPAREAAYYRLVVPANQPNWKLRLTPTTGDALLIVQRDFLPNVSGGASGSRIGAGVKLQKLDREHYLVLPADGEALLSAETNYLVVAGEGVGGDQNTGIIGSGVTTYRLESLGPIAVANLGTLGAAPGSSLSQSVSLEGGEVKLFRFTVSSNTPALEIRLNNRTGNPSFTARSGTNSPYPHVTPPPFGDYYGAEGGYFLDRREDYSLVTIANPTPGVYSLTMKGEDEAGVYPNAFADLVVTARGATAMVFNNGATNIVNQEPRTWRYFEVTVPVAALGWDLRMNNVAGGSPQMLVRRDLLPEPGIGDLNIYGGDWPSGSQLSATIADWTGRTLEPDTSVRKGQILAVGRDNPLVPGTYIVGVYNNSSDETTSYSILSRGIGTGFAIGITNLNFSGAGSAITNNTGLAGREAVYHRIVIPANTSSWKLRLTPTGGGEAMLLVHRDEIPNTATHPTDRHDGIGRKVQKLDQEHYLLLPDQGQNFLEPGTNYIVVVGEGNNPPDSTTLGAGNVTYRLESLGAAPVTSLGTVPNVGGGQITQHIVLEGGEVKLFRFAISNTIPSVEIRLNNRVGTPTLVMIPGTNAPYAGVPLGPSLFDDGYGVDGGWLSERLGTYDLLVLNEPAIGIYSVSIKGDDAGGLYPNAEFDLIIGPVGVSPLAFNGGTTNVAEHAPGTWRFFSVTVPGEVEGGELRVEGWDLRLNNFSGGSPQLIVRRDDVPTLAGGAPSVDPFGTNWPSGAQLSAGSDWTGLLEPDSQSLNGRFLVVGRNNPLEPGDYIVGVFNQDPTIAANYTINSRGIGSGLSIPVGTIGFGGGAATPPYPSVAHPGLDPREVAYYQIEIPAGAASWRVRLDTSPGGEAMLLIRKGVLPNSFNGAFPHRLHTNGKNLRKAGNEHYVLLPEEGQAALEGGVYYIGVVSEGVNPAGNTIGSGPSSFVLESLGVLPSSDLPIPAFGSLSSTPVAMEGGQTKAFHFSVPGGVNWLELRLANRLGEPAMAVRRGAEWPHPSVPASVFNPYGADGGWFSTRLEGYTFFTLIRPDPGIYALTVKGESFGGEYPDAAADIELEQKAPVSLAFSNGMVSAVLAENQRVFYQVVVPTNVLGWKLDLSITNGNPVIRARKDLLPSDDEPAMPFGGPSVILAPPFLEPGTWYVEVKGQGPSEFKLTSNPVLLHRVAWNMPAFGAPVTTPGLTNTPFFADTGFATNGTALPLDQGTDLGEGDFHYYAFNVPGGNGGLLRGELLAISGNPDMFVRQGGLPTFAHLEFGTSGRSLVDFQLTGTGTEYGNWVPIDGRTETQLTPGPWYVAVRANGSNARYRLKLSTGNVTSLAAGAVLGGQSLAAGDWRYYRFVLPTNAPRSLAVSYSQQQGDTELYVRDTVPPGEPSDPFSGFRRWNRDAKNGGPYPDFPDAGTYTLDTPPLRPGHVYYLGFRAVNDATFTVGFTTNAQTINVTNVVNFYGGVSTVAIPAFGVEKFRVAVPVDATSWRHSNTHSAAVEVYLDQGTLPDLEEPTYWIWQSGGGADSQLIQFLYGWPWVAEQNYYFVATNTSGVAQALTIRMDGRNLATDDSDGDGLPDGWEILYFGNLSQSGSDHGDGDGIDNATELAEGTNPANAASLRPRLTVNVTGGGLVVIEPELTNYTAGQSVTLTAVADGGAAFTGWSGDVVSVANPLMVTMDSSKVVTAVFEGSAVGLTLDSARQLGNGNIEFTVNGPAGSSLVIEAVGELEGAWMPVHTNAPFEGVFIFEDLESLVQPKRFYRAVLRP